MEVEKYLKLFLSHMAKSSQITYFRVICEFVKFLGRKSFLKATESDAWDYVLYLKNKPGIKARHSNDREFSNRTIIKNVAILRKFYSRLIDIKKMKNNPFEIDLEIKQGSIPQKLPTELVPFDYVRKFLRLPDLTTKSGIRDCALLAVLFGTSIRKNEARMLSLGDYRTSQGGTEYLQIRFAKGGKGRKAALPEWALKPILALIEQRKREFADEESSLFVHYDDKGYWSTDPLDPKTIWRIFKNYARQLGLKHVSPHSARATVTTKLLADGCTHNEVMEVTGHSSVQMVEVYNKREISVDKSVGKNICWT